MAPNDQPDDGHDVAIVGMACRFPGARNVNEYWHLLRDPKPQFGTVPESRWHHDSFLSEDLRDPHSAYTDQMATITDVGAFDAAYYGIPPQRARTMDPQHRLLVDLTREAIQDAGWDNGGFDREDTAVIMGLSESGYREFSAMKLRIRQLAYGEFGAPTPADALAEGTRAVEDFHGTALPGLLLNMGPGAVSSVFGLHGDSYALDAACSSGLAAVANAVLALRTGRCRTAFAGGAQLVLAPDIYIGLCRVGALSRTGTCRPFDHRADGPVIGEGGGVLALRLLGDARRAGDRIYAVIRGVGLSNDGTVRGGMTPQAHGQLLALRRAYADADLAPESVRYIETHGTATAVGDRVEIEALRGLRAAAAAPAYLGAAKAVIGHTLAASGIAGLIKAALVVHQATIVPQPDFEPSAALALDGSGFVVPSAPLAWPAAPAQPRRAGVSAFGFGGTNVHVVLEQAAPAPSPGAADDRAELLLLSARDAAGLARHARQTAAVLADERPSLAAVATTLAGRAPLAVRLAVVATSIDDAVRKLTAASMSLDSGTVDGQGPSVVAGRVVAGPGAAGPGAAGSGAADAGPPVTVTVDEPDPVRRVVALQAVARRVVSASALHPPAGPAARCTLPPSPLSPKHYWIVDEAKRDGAAGPHRPETLPETLPDTLPADPPRPGPVVDGPVPGAPVVDPADVLDAVVDEVARISAFSVTELSAQQELVADLGFDSLMLHELATSLEAALPRLWTGDDLTGDGLTIAGVVSRLVPDAPHNAPKASEGPVAAASEGPVAAAPEGPVAAASEAPTGWAAATADIAAFPEVRALADRYRMIERLGLPNPYFREHEGNVRNTTVVADRRRLSFGSYNYLGLSGHPVVNDAVHAAVERYGSSVSASRVLSGDRPLIRELERALAGLLGTEDCLSLVSGHATNVTAIGHLVSGADLIVHDALCHDSILQGCTLSGARRRPFAHNDLAQLETILRQTRSRFRRVLLVVEGVYSMDGDLVDLPALIELKKRYGALLMIDEAHSIGAVGPHGGGVGDFYGVDRGDVDLWMGTLSKSLASCGGYLAGSAKVVEWLRYTLPGFVYSVGLTPPNAAAALAAVRLIGAEPHRLTALRENSELFLRLAKAGGVPTGSSANTPIVPCVVGDSVRTLRLASRLFERGIVVDPILYPAVDERETRLRFFLTSEHADYEIGYAVSTLVEELSRLPG